jgi:hypothetical protein
MHPANLLDKSVPETSIQLLWYLEKKFPSKTQESKVNAISALAGSIVLFGMKNIDPKDYDEFVRQISVDVLDNLKKIGPVANKANEVAKKERK